GVYQLKNGLWVKFDTYTLAAKELPITGGKVTIDFEIARTFRIQNTANATVDLKNIPGADRSTTIMVKIYGKVGSFNWTIPN
ncbi:hypothetical protein Q0N58_15140, partial [Staphylococcus aureus]|nr:hypothetical protein [Staphylococcus aureus]